MKRVVVAMSGGVDSSVVAMLLKREGYDVIGLTMQLYDYSSSGGSNKIQKTCCASKDIGDAESVARKIGIAHYVLNYESVFKEEVIDKFVDEYLAGSTPIPCISCNQTVKFRDMYKFAKKLGAEFLATGHYVRRVESKDGNAELHVGADISKDQSYFLYSTTMEQLQFLRFPLGNVNKDEVRKMAKDAGLIVANKPDSQDICFVPNGDYASVIKKVRPDSIKTGDIVDISTGTVIGNHDGIVNYTIGQRRGIGIANSDPLFVVKINAATNTILVGTKDYLYESNFFVKNINWLTRDDSEKSETLKFRLRSSPYNTSEGRMVSINVGDDINGETAEIVLSKPMLAITPGQACVFYKGTKVIGGGVISSVKRK